MSIRPEIICTPRRRIEFVFRADIADVRSADHFVRDRIRNEVRADEVELAEADFSADNRLLAGDGRCVT
jgi:hypothetical protein